MGFHFVSVHLNIWCMSDLKDTIFIICYLFLMTETLFQNKHLKTETQVLFNCATYVWRLDTDHTSVMVSYLYLIFVICLQGTHIKKRLFLGGVHIISTHQAIAWCKCFCSCNSMSVIHSDTRYTNLFVYPTRFRKDFIQSCWCNSLPRKQCMAKGVPCFCLFLLLYSCSILSWNVRCPVNSSACFLYIWDVLFL